MSQPNSYEAVIGLEVHIQLSTKSKAFCSDSTSYGAMPNRQVSAVSLAHPGTLPRANTTQIEYAIKLGLSLKSRISKVSYFDRKHYFYADLPKGFQTTQDNAPICIGGNFSFYHNDGLRNIRIHHIHMEEDAGKSMHEGDTSYSKIDLNRAGVPLLEMVTEPDFRSAEEVYDFIHAMRLHVQYLGISDGNMEEGSIRCDCNVSVRLLGEQQLNNRCEIKNVNSARFARKAISYEIDRQIKMMKSGMEVAQQTREFIPDEGITKLLRTKEDAYDYRYFPEPDLPPLHIGQEQLEDIGKSLSESPLEKYIRYTGDWQIAEKDAKSIIADPEVASSFEAFLEYYDVLAPDRIAKFWINQLLPSLSTIETPTRDLMFARCKDYLDLLASGDVNRSVAHQKLWPLVLQSSADVRDLAKDIDILKSKQNLNLQSIVAGIIEANPEQSAKFRKGKKALIGFFIGQVMRQTKGQADPHEVEQVIRESFEVK